MRTIEIRDYTNTYLGMGRKQDVSVWLWQDAPYSVDRGILIAEGLTRRQAERKASALIRVLDNTDVRIERCRA